jgi:transposase
MNPKRSKSTHGRKMPLVHPNAAAIDVGATMHMAAVRADRAPEPVRSFGTFTADLHRLIDWFTQCGVETVVMESTSVYWIPVFELLDARGFTVCLVNARDAKHVPGRKTDVSDAQWLQRLHSFGLLRASFRPKGQIAELRSYVRQRVLKELSIHRGRDHGAVPPPRRRHRTDQVNALAFDVRAALFALLGKDITAIDGLGAYLSLKLIAECGDDLSSWPSAKHFTSWLGLAPSNKISGGKMLSSRTRRSGGRAAALLRLAAVAVGRTDTALGAFYRRLSSRIGKAKAVTATARKVAVLFYNAVRHGMEYVDPGASSYETRYRTRVVNNLHRRAKAFGFVLQPLEPKAGAAVS